MATTMERLTVGMTRTLVLIMILLQMVLITGSSAADVDSQDSYLPNNVHEAIINPLSWKAYAIDCNEGITLSGNFEVSCDGDLYPGDEQKYDDWSPHHIQFYILNETEYAKFAERKSFTPNYVREDVSGLNWEFEITMTGQWYIVYYNTEIYMMTVSGTFTQSGGVDALLTAGIFLPSSLVVLGIIHYLKKKGRKP
jgi:hypothetical protein